MIAGANLDTQNPMLMDLLLPKPSSSTPAPEFSGCFPAQTGALGQANSFAMTTTFEGMRIGHLLELVVSRGVGVFSWESKVPPHIKGLLTIGFP